MTVKRNIYAICHSRRSAQPTLYCAFCYEIDSLGRLCPATPHPTRARHPGRPGILPSVPARISTRLDLHLHTSLAPQTRSSHKGSCTSTHSSHSCQTRATECEVLKDQV